MSVFVAAARELGPRFAERAPLLDQSGGFVEENYRELKALKLMSAGIPAELGGGGASHNELCDMLRTLAHYCPSTALALSMHTHLVSAAVWRHLHGQPAAALLGKVVEAERVLVSTGASDWLESNGSVARVDGGFRVSAKKRFASGSPAGDIVLTSAPYDDPVDGPVVLHFGVSLKAEGVRLESDWDTLGMRATGSHTLSFDGVFVPEATVSLKRPRGKWHPSYALICRIALPLIVSVYVGIAESAAELAKAAGRKRTDDPHLPYQLGEMENALVTAQMALREMMAAVPSYDFPVPDMDQANAALIRKSIAAEAVERSVRKAFEASGGSAFFRKNPLERLARDVQAVHFHPMPERKQTWLTGRLALGLPPQ
jgi:alkylation response protein AidB-like acyl-CoA dehydrogenase